MKNQGVLDYMGNKKIYTMNWPRYQISCSLIMQEFPDTSHGSLA